MHGHQIRGVHARSLHTGGCDNTEHEAVLAASRMKTGIHTQAVNAAVARTEPQALIQAGPKQQTMMAARLKSAGTNVEPCRDTVTAW